MKPKTHSWPTLQKALPLLNKSALAAAAGIARHRFQDFERGKSTPTNDELKALWRVIYSITP
jgi:hypothetical protein